MPGKCRSKNDVDAPLDREAWLQALARSIARGRYRPDADRIALALARAWSWPEASDRRRR